MTLRGAGLSTVLRQAISLSHRMEVEEFDDAFIEPGTFHVAVSIGERGRRFCTRLAASAVRCGPFACAVTPSMSRSGVHWLSLADESFIVIQHSAIKVDSVYDRLRKMREVSTNAWALRQHLVLPILVVVGASSAYFVMQDRGPNLLQAVARGLAGRDRAREVFIRAAALAWKSGQLLQDVAPRNLLLSSQTFWLCDLEWGSEPYQGPFRNYLEVLVQKNGLEIYDLFASGEHDPPGAVEGVTASEVRLIASEAARRSLASLCDLAGTNAILEQPASRAMVLQAIKHWDNLGMRFHTIQIVRACSERRLEVAAALLASLKHADASTSDGPGSAPPVR